MDRKEKYRKHIQSLRDRLAYSQEANSYVECIKLEAMIVEANATYVVLLQDGYFKGD